MSLKNTTRNKKEEFKYLRATGYDPYKGVNGEYYFDVVEADKAVKFFHHELKFSKGKWKGKPFTLSDWEVDVVRCLFGWRDTKTKLRRYSELFIFVPRKNGKSEIIAGIADYIFMRREENDAEIYIGAKDRPQALVLYRMAEKMLAQNPRLFRRVTPKEAIKTVMAKWDDSKIEAVSSDAMSKHGYSASVAIIDELHTIKNPDFPAAFKTGMGGREQPLMIYITTADQQGPSLCNEKLEIAKSVRDGKIKNLRYMPVIYETPPDADWKDPAVWAKANPNYPETPSHEYLENQLTEALHSLRAEMNFKRFHLNMSTSTNVGWLDIDAWKAGNIGKFQEESLSGQLCYAGIDLANKIDLSALVLYFPSTHHLLCRFYCSKAAVTKDKSGHYEEWTRAGFIKIAGDRRTDFNFIKEDLQHFAGVFDLDAIAYDPHNASQFANDLEASGFDDDKLFEFVQSFRNYTEPSKEFEALINAGLLKHSSPVLDWMAGNVTIRTGPSDDWMPQKPKKGSPLKIDGISAAIMALGLAMKFEHKEQKPESVFDEEGFDYDDLWKEDGE